MDGHIDEAWEYNNNKYQEDGGALKYGALYDGVVLMNES